MQQYSELSENYESIYLKVGWTDPLKIAELADEITPEESKSTSLVLDLGCGTGLVGKYLDERKFKIIDGIDATENMVNIAKEKKVYRDFDIFFLGKPASFPVKYHGKYDIVTASGLLAEGHVDC